MDMLKLSELEKEIIALFQNENKKIKKHIIIKTLIDSYSEEQIIETLNNLEINGYLYLNTSKEYQLFWKCQIKMGELKYNDKTKEFYVVSGKSVLKVPSKYLNGAIPGDIVVIKASNHKSETVMVVDKIIKRTEKGLVFDYVNGSFKPFNCDAKIKLSIPEEQMSKLVNGSRVLVKISLQKTNNAYNGQIISLVGHKDDPHLDIKTIASKNGAIIDFSKEAMEQAEALPNEVTEEAIQERLEHDGIDLRNKTIFTIDGENTKDIDDAVSIEKLPNGNYLLGVHIADVSHYVEEESPLDLEARERSTSIYPYNYVIPMLPHKLSNGICSLNPNVDRLALTWLIEIDSNGEIINYEVRNSIINSKKKMSYEKVNDIFEKHIMHEDYEPFIGDLALMIELSNILNQKKIDRGYLSFGDDDVKFVDDNGSPIEIRKRIRGTAEKMIEDFMLTANEVTATITDNLQIPGIYRNHPAPNPDSIKAILEMLKLNIHVPNNIDNKKIQTILKKIQNFDESGSYLELLLQSMKRAYYSVDNIGHFGLALNDYTHTTSPIRRYPDLVTHRIIKAFINASLTEDYNGLTKKLIQITQNASSKERLADKIEKEANLYKMAELMEHHIGDCFIAYVSYISKNGLSIKTEHMVTGKITMEQLLSLGFKYQADTNSLENSELNISLHIGDKIQVRVKNADKDACKIDFEFIEKIQDAKVRIKKAI